MNALRIFVFSACIAFSGCEQSSERVRFEPMRAAVVNGQYDKGIALLEDYVADQPQGEHASRAGLFLSKAHFAKGEYEEAKKWCDWTIQNHPDSLEARKCEFKIGLILIAQERPDEALKQFEAVASSNRNPLRPEAEFFVDYLQKKVAGGIQQQLGEAEPR